MRSRQRVRWATATVAAVLATAAVACGGSGGPTSESATSRAAEPEILGTVDQGVRAEVQNQLSASTTAAAAKAAAADAALTSARSPAGGAPPSAAVNNAANSAANQAPPVIGADRKLVRSINVRVRLDQPTFTASWARLYQIALESGGTVSTATLTPVAEPIIRRKADGTEETVPSPRSGQLVMRVPVDRFDATRQRVVDIGELVEEGSNTTDVTDQVVDLDARIRAAQATEGTYLQLLAKAETIPDILTVQDRLTAVRTQIEQLVAQRNSLEGQAAFSTIAVTLFEKGTPEDKPVIPPVVEPKTGLARAWERATDGFVAVIGGLVVAVVTISPLLALAAIALLVAWPFLRRRRAQRTPAKPTGVTPPPTATPANTPGPAGPGAGPGPNPAPDQRAA